jgi:hypothetical protein
MSLSVFPETVVTLVVPIDLGYYQTMPIDLGYCQTSYLALRPPRMGTTGTSSGHRLLNDQAVRCSMHP